MGNKIAASTVSRYLARAKPRFTAKVAQDQEPEGLTDNWRKGSAEMVERSQDRLREQTMKTKLLSMRMKLRTKVVLAWENPFDQGRGTRPTYTLHVYAKKDRVLHWDLSDQNADTKEIERVAMQQHR